MIFTRSIHLSEMRSHNVPITNHPRTCDVVPPGQLVHSGLSRGHSEVNPSNRPVAHTMGTDDELDLEELIGCLLAPAIEIGAQDFTASRYAPNLLTNIFEFYFFARYSIAVFGPVPVARKSSVVCKVLSNPSPPRLTLFP